MMEEGETVCTEKPQKKSELKELEDNIVELKVTSVDLKVRANDLLYLLRDDGVCDAKEDIERPKSGNRFDEAGMVINEIREDLLRTRDVLCQITCMVNK